jgi:hypothetical protein
MAERVEANMPIKIDGVEVRKVKTQAALTYTALGRTKFYEICDELKILPVRMGNRSLWEPADLDRIVDHVETIYSGVAT